MRNKKLAATFLALTLVSAATPASAEGMEVDWDILLHFGNEHRQSGPPRHEPPPPPPRHPHLLRVTVMEVMSHDDNKRNDEKDRVKEEVNANNKGVRI